MGLVLRFIVSIFVKNIQKKNYYIVIYKIHVLKYVNNVDIFKRD